VNNQKEYNKPFSYHVLGARLIISRRKGQKGKKSLEHHRRSIAKWAIRTIEEVEYAAEFLETDENIDFYALIEHLDPTGKILSRIDKTAVNAVKPEERNYFFRCFNSAVVTQMAREVDLLQPLLKSGLVSFGHDGHKTGYTVGIPALEPISDELPGFSLLFLGFFQSCLKARFSEYGMIPMRHLNADSCSPSAVLPERGIQPGEEPEGPLDGEDLIALTQAAALLYFNTVMQVKDDDVAAKLAELNSIHIFLWLGAIGLLQDMADGLINGRPLLRKITESNGEVHYIRAEDGPESPLFQIDDNIK
jgi:hypothetical protein